MSGKVEKSLRSQVAELFIVRASGHNSDKQRRYPAWELSNAHLKRLLNEGIGGVILFGGSTNEVKERCKTLLDWAQKPLLLCADIEEGVGQRFEGGTWFVPPMAISRIYAENPLKGIELAELYGRYTAYQAKFCGINWILGPVCDINNNPKNPVINLRAWGEEEATVSTLICAFHRGVTKEKLLTCAKHFPGHGDTSIDSHLDLPIIKHNLSQLKSRELLPFIAAINEGVKCVMTGHLLLEAIDRNLPATLSKKIINEILRKEMKYEDLIVTDALIMNSISKKFGNSEAVILAFEAGVDLILMPEDIDDAINSLCEAINSGRISRDRLNESLSRRKRILEELATGTNKANLLNDSKKQSPIELKIHNKFSNELIINSQIIINPNTVLNNGNPVNLVRVDEVLDSQILSKSSPALSLPSSIGFKNIICHKDGVSPWSNDELNPLSFEKLGTGPIFLQLFIRGNPFTENGHEQEQWVAAVKQLQKKERLLGLIVYGTPYLWDKLIKVLNPLLPAAYSPGQMQDAQELALKSLINSEYLASDSHKGIRTSFTN